MRLELYGWRLWLGVVGSSLLATPATATPKACVQVSGDLRVSAPEWAPGPTLSNLRFACGSTHCLAVTEQQIGAYPYGSLRMGLDRQGHVVSGPHLTSLGAPGMQVTTSGDDFVIGYATSGFVYLSRVRAADGSLLDDLATTGVSDPEAAFLHRLVDAGSHVAVVYRANPSPYGIRVAFWKDGALVPSAAKLPSAFSLPAVVAGPGQVLIAEGNFAVRVDAATGAILDNPPIQLTKYEPVPSQYLDGYYDGQDYQLFWAGEINSLDVIQTVRVGTDGTLVDAYSDFDEAPGSRNVLKGYSAIVEEFHVDPLGGPGALLRYRDLYQGAFQAILVDAAGARLPSDGLPTDPPTAILDGYVGVARRMVFDGQGGLYSPGEGIYPLTVGSDGLPVAGPALPPVQVSLVDRFARVASNGTDFFVVWQRVNTDGTRRIVGSRLSGATGAYLDTPPIEIGNQGMPTVASNGTDYLLAWVSDFTNGVVTYGRVDGATGDAYFSHTLNEGYTLYNLVSAFDGTRYILGWATGTASTVAVRLDASTLEPLDSPRLAVGLGEPTSFAVRADTSPAPALRTFLFASVNFDDNTLHTSRVRSASGNVLSTSPIGSRPDLLVQPDSLHLTTNGTEFLALWQEYVNSGVNSGHIWATRIDSLTGTQLASRVDVFGATASTRIPANVTYTDETYLGLVNVNGVIQGRRMNAADLSFVDATPFPVGANYAPGDAEWGLALGTNGAGRSLVLYAGTDPARLNLTIIGRFLDPADSCSAAGGAAGVGGSAGAAGTSGSSGGGGGVTGSGGATGETNGTPGGSAGTGGSASAGGAATAGTPSAAGSSARGGGAGLGATTGGTTSTTGGSSPTSGGPGSTAGGTVARAGSSAIAGAFASIAGATGAGGNAAAPVGGSAVAGASGAARPGTSGASTSGATATPASAGQDEGSGCGCRTAGTAPSGSRFAWIAALVGSVLIRRRRGRIG